VPAEHRVRLTTSEFTNFATTSTTAALCNNPDAPSYIILCQPIMSCALPTVTNLLQKFVDGEESRMTPIIRRG